MIDLHCYSTVSDGMLSPAEVVRLAHQNGCTLLTLTDHDHTGNIAEACAETDAIGLHLVNDVEISVTWCGRTIHAVGLDFNEQDENLQNLLTQVRQDRLKRLEAIAAKFEKKGIGDAYDSALTLAANGEMASRTHVTEFLIQAGHTKNKQQAFTKYLGGSKSCAVHHERATLANCASVVNSAGGMVVIAYPIRYGLSVITRRNLFEEFKDLGGVDIEVHGSDCCKNGRLSYAFLAERFGMFASVGSDFHHLNGSSGGIPDACPELPESCRSVRAHFKPV